MPTRKKKRTSVAGHALDKAQDAAGAMVGQVAAALGGASDEPFFRNAWLSGLYEVESSHIALRRARTQKVKALADKLCANHAMSAQLLSSALARSAIEDADRSLPDALDARRQGMLDHLKRAPDEAFDAAFLDQQIAAHGEAATLYETYARSGEDVSLRAYAHSTLPGIEAHARAIEGVRAVI